MIFAQSQWLALMDETNMDNVDCEAVILALMCDLDPRLAEYDNAELLDNMNRDTVFCHVAEFYRNKYPV